MILNECGVSIFCEGVASLSQAWEEENIIHLSISPDELRDLVSRYY